MAKSLDELAIGEKIGPSIWIAIDQHKIDQFAEATGDFQWIHVDKARCEKDSPFICPIAHGLLSTSLTPAVFYELIKFAPELTILNYGIDSLRFIEAVRVGDLIRYHVTLDDIQDKANGKLFRFAVEVEIKDRPKPAMVGMFLMMLVTQQ